MPSTTGFIGFDNFVWFQGVVEDRFDPLKLGRVRVRILGLHTEVKPQIPTEDLPWAYPIQPITSAAMNGIGETPLGPVEGTWVVGFFRDGENCQEPVIMGTLAGIPQEYPYPRNKQVGFLDPLQDLSKRARKLKKKEYPNDGTGAVLESEVPTPPTGESYPRKSHPFGSTILESDINRLARKENITDTIVQIKKDSRETSIPIADGSVWDEPLTPYNSHYPYNHVEESESGHISEIDDTPGVERLHTYHRSGSFQEIYPDGIKVEKIVGNSYKIVLEEAYEHIQNRYNLTIDGPFNVLVQNDANITVKGNANIQVGKNMTTDVGGDYSLNVKGSATIQSEGPMTVKSSDSTVIGGGSISFRGDSVSSYPPVDESLVSYKSNSSNFAIRSQQLGPSMGGAIPTHDSDPQSVSVNKPDDNTLEREYPREVPEYVSLAEE